MAQWPGLGGSRKPIRSNWSMVAISDDNMMMKQILATHSPDEREVDVRPLFRLVEDILYRSTFQADTNEMGGQAQMGIEDKAELDAGFAAMIDAISYTIDRISCEIACKALSGSDANATTVSLFSILSNYSWDAKLVVTLAAFALHYGEFWLLAQLYSRNQLAKSVAILKQVTSILEHTGALKSQWDGLNNLIRAMMDVTRCITRIKDTAQDAPELSTAMAHIPVAVYWTIRSVVACATQITTLTSMGHEFVRSTSETWELSTLAHKLKKICESLNDLMAKCFHHIDERNIVEAYSMVTKLLELSHFSSVKILEGLINPKDDLEPLVVGSTKERVNVEVLQERNVLLLISGLNISEEEFLILKKIYNESWLDNHYVVVWIPIVDHVVHWDDSMQKQFESLQSLMPWYTICRPSLIERAMIRIVKDFWHFENKPILVVLDPDRRVVSPNALHMMRIWGSNAFPFTSSREEALWEDETWRLELLVDGIDPLALNWIKEEKYIFLYGGDNIEWVQRFTKAARSVASAARIDLEMLYVGKRSNREQVRRVMATIKDEKRSHYWEDMTRVWSFWTRLESMLLSKIQLGRADDHNDPMTQQIKKLVSYDRDGGWALLSKGSRILVNGDESTILRTLREYDIWKEQVAVKGFGDSFVEHHQKLN